MSTGDDQLSLAFRHRPSVAGEDYLIGTANAEAIRWLNRWPRWPAPALAIHGPPGCGKSHLVHAFIHRTGGRLVEAGALAGADPATLAGCAPCLAVDDADMAVGLGLSQPLLHLYNSVREAGCHLILTGQQPPARWPIPLKDLSSRLISCPAVGIGAPDDSMIAAVLVKLFADRQLRPDETVIQFTVQRMERSFDAARRLVARIDAQSLASRRNITVPLVRSVLETAAPDAEGSE